MKFEFVFGRTIGRGALAIVAALAAGLATATPAPALAQGTLNPQPAQGAAKSCPEGWSDYDFGKRTGVCKPGPNAKPAYYPQGSAKCATGYTKKGIFCVEGKPPTIMSTAGSVNKAHPLDRCPIAYFTYGNGSACTSRSPNPPTVRLKGDADCNPGEVEDWGLWCVSNYEGLARKDATKGIADYNGVYQASFKATGTQQGPRQPDLPEGGEYTPAYFEIFGRVDKDGNPLAGGGAQAATTVADAAANPASAVEAAVKQCVPKPKKKKGGLGGALGGLAKEVATELGVPTEDGC